MKCKICQEENELTEEDSVLETLNCKWNLCGDCYTELEGEIENWINNRSEEKMKVNITLGDMAESLADLRKNSLSFFTNFTDKEIYSHAVELRSKR